MSTKTDNLLYFLVLSLPPALVTGPFLPDLFISICTIIFLINLFIKKQINLFKNDFVEIFLIFYIYIVIRSLFSDEILFSLKNTFFYFRFLALALLIKYLIINKANFLKFFMISILLSLVIVSIDAIVEFSLDYHWLFDKSKYAEFSVSNRISGLFDEEYILGGFILSFFPITLILFKEFYKKKKKYFINFFLILVIILFVYAIIITGERATLAKLCLLLIIIILFTKILGNWKIKLIYLFSFIIFLFVSISFQPILKERLIYHTLNLLLQNEANMKISDENNLTDFIKNKKFTDIKITYYSNEHSDHALISLKMFNNNILFGQGVKMFRVFCLKKDYYINDRACSTHSHGVLLSFLSELGVIGLSFLILIYFLLFKLFLKSNSNSQKILLITLFIYLFPLIPSGYFFNNYFSIVLYILTGLYLGIKKIKNII